MHPRLHARLSARARALLSARVRALLEPRARALDALQISAGDLEEQVRALDDRLRIARRGAEALESELRLWREPFHADMTVHQAWLRHSRAREVFARHHLPACDRCAVRFEETLGEAAAAYRLDLEALLSQLNALLLRG